MFERKFPLMSFNQVHAICRNQERNVEFILDLGDESGCGNQGKGYLPGNE